MTKARDLASGSGIEAGEVVPHIIPNVLYPAVAGKDIDGVAVNTSHGSTYTYGTTHADGRMYYYTDIKGSKPIKDPRIGGHFGATRHRTSSVQLREQETAAHGKNVYSVDGRDWIRIVGDNGSSFYNTGGSGASCWDTDNFWEITFYGNQLLVQQDNHNANRGWTVTIDGGTASAERSPAQGSIDGGVLGGRYVNAGSIGDTQMSETLGIHTVKLTPNGASDECTFNAIETIAQDTTSTANKSKIQIPSQNVVSYGKKFTVSGTPHYDPFNGFTSGNLAAVQALIETDTSLGMANWLSSSTYYRPFNGGRVVKWVDSSGNIKTSVTMMPPNAQNINGTASNAIDLSSSQTNDDTINFNTSAIDHSLSEVAKQYHWSEFGNGSANAGTGGSYKDWSMNNASSHERAYVMDDGLTSLSSDHAVFGADAENDVLGCRIAVDTGVQNTYFTFIGTGISAELKEWDSGAKFDAVGFQTLAQNLPYGTHVIKIARDNTGTDQVTLLVDGISAQVEAFNVDHNALETLRFMSFHQPKKPPIPEDAVVLADYMLVADFVKTGTSGMDVISKGVRKISLTRDVFVDSSSALGANVEINTGFSYYMRAFTSGSAKVTTKLPAFASEVTWQGEMGTASIDSSENSWGGNAITMAQASGGTGTTEIITYSSGTKPELGMNNFQHLTQNGGYRTNAMEIATPIHTSSHYQTFETPFLNELVGGDRNMEQTNLIVTADGKSWDEVTRNTSYLGKNAMICNTDTETGDGDRIIFDEYRGSFTTHRHYGNKDFAIAYNTWICLRDGWYQWSVISYARDAKHFRIYIDGQYIVTSYNTGADQSQETLTYSQYMSRGQYFYLTGPFGKDGLVYNHFEVIRLD